MRNFFYYIVLTLSVLSCKSVSEVQKDSALPLVNATLDSWHQAASEAKFDRYFSLMTNDAVFIGTDPTENWQNKDFKTYSKPYFDKGKAWNFKSLERNVYFNDNQTIAWFDELLSTQMKICRGSGVLKKQNGQWKIAHYVLSITIPNDNTNEVVKIKSDFDEVLIKKIQNK